MAGFYHLLLMSLVALMLASQLDVASAAVRVFGLYAKHLAGDPFGNYPDPYVKVWCSSSFGGMTDFHRDTASPSWSAEFNFPNCKANDILSLQVWDKDLNFDDHLGTCIRQVANESSSITCYLNIGSLYYRYELK